MKMFNIQHVNAVQLLLFLCPSPAGSSQQEQILKLAYSCEPLLPENSPLPQPLIIERGVIIISKHKQMDSIPAGCDGTCQNLK